MEDLLTVEQAAAKLQVTPRTIKNWIRTGRLKGYKAGGRIWRLKESDLEAFLEASTKPQEAGDSGSRRSP